MARRSRKPKGPKKVSYQLIDRERSPAMYRLLARLVEQHHSELKDARIALAWCSSWRADVDGRITLGQCKKASDLDRELMAWDFIILLQQAFFADVSVTDEQRAALIDHELCHATVKLDPLTHEPIEDERGRTVYRLRRHDLEEFGEIVERHGCYKRDLELFAQSMLRARQQPLLEDMDAARQPRRRPLQPGTH